jgi:hypothetical protein
MKQLAGMPQEEVASGAAAQMLNEATVIDDTMGLEQIASMMDGARRGLGIANRITDPDMKKKHVRAIFINMNKIRAALARILRSMDVTDLGDEV